METSFGRQVKAILNIDLSKPSVSDSLNSLSSLTDSYPLQKDLKSLLKRRSLHTYKCFIEDFKPIIQQIKNLETTHNNLIENLETISTEVNRCIEKTDHAVRQGKKLQQEFQHYEKRQGILDCVMNKVTLSEQEKVILTSPEKELDESFFNALNKLQTLSETSLVLDTNDSRLLKFSLDDYISEIQEAAYEKLFRFVQQQCKILQQEKVEVLPGFYSAISHLKNRPVYYNHCRKELIKSRQYYFLRRFRKTLTSGEEAIERHISDPPLFIGECLAWIHSTLISEKHLIEGLLGNIETLTAEGENLQESTIIDKIADPSVNDLKDFVEKAINQCSLLDSFHSLRIIAFYIRNFTDTSILSFASMIIKSLYEISTLCEEKLGQRVLQSLTHIKLFSISTDLQVPRAFMERFTEFCQLLKVIDSNREFLPFYQNLYKDLITKSVEFYKEEAKSAFDTARAAVLMINILNFIKFALSEYDFAVNELQELDEDIGLDAEDLIKASIKSIIEQYNLAENFLPRNLQTFAESVLTEGKLAMPVIDSLQDMNIRNKVKSIVASSILETYRGLLEKVNENDRPSAILEQLVNL
ncbi:unnamed protein product [Blepharisma stoltei]|uniref:Conserved oligomeric Golgi complex subunit 6 n=1 Tax=Blepharisma stoltei TaxID=1481888 RepID=A0AAU9JVV1_9CILI|nr:unnamed protein product [Blepharisma stoltei]